MIKNSLRQKGSAHVVIIVILVLALIGALGFAFWQNYISNDGKVADMAMETQADVEVEPMSDVASEDTFGTNFSIKYPKEWKHDHTFTGYQGDGTAQSYASPNDEVNLDENVVTSPSGNLTVKLSATNNTGLGGTCENNSLSLVSIKRDDIPNYTNAKYVEYIINSKSESDSENRYKFYAGVQRNEQDLNSVSTQSNSACSLNYAGLLNFKTYSADGGHLPLVTLNITFNKLKAPDNSYEYRSVLSLTDIQAAMSGDEYETAKAIIRSLYVKESR